MGSNKVKIKIEITVQLSKKSRKALKRLLERVTPSNFVLQPTEEEASKKTVALTLSTTEQKEEPEEKVAETTATQKQSKAKEEKTKKTKKSGKQAKRFKGVKRKEISPSEVQPGEQPAFDLDDLDFDEEVMALKEENDD